MHVYVKQNKKIIERNMWTACMRVWGMLYTMIAKKITIIKKKNLKKLGLKWDPGKKETRELMTKLEMTVLAILLIILHRFCHYWQTIFFYYFLNYIFNGRMCAYLLEIDFYPDHSRSPYITRDRWTYGLARLITNETEAHHSSHTNYLKHRLIIIYNTCLIETLSTPYLGYQ